MISPSDFGLPLTFPSFRERQLEISTEAASNPHRFYILNLPVGGGKSLICQTYAKLKGGRTITLAPTKNLQSQLEGDFSDMVNIYGHSHYECASSSMSSDGELDFECMSGPSLCDYRPRVTAAFSSSNVLTNPAHWTTILKSDMPERLGKFDNLIIDECHRIHDMLCDYMAFTISPRRIFRLIRMEISLPSSAPLSHWHQWAIEARERCHSEIAKLRDSQQRDGSRDERQVRRLMYLREDLSRFIETWPGTEWVVADIPYSDHQIKITPVWAEKFAERYLFNEIPNIFMCSGTIQEQSLSNLGIQPGQYIYRDEDSLFPPERSPLIYIPTISVNAKMSDGDRGVLVRRIDQIIEESLAYKGTIQATGYEWARQVANRSKWANNVMLCGLDKDSAKEAFERFDSDASKPPDVLLSPVIKEGLDLHGDKCRYQIIPKIPFPDLRDPLTAARAKSDKLYMTRSAVLSLEQMKGRSTRSKSDWSVTYMLDDGWDAPWFRKIAPFSRSFRRCVRKVESVKVATAAYKVLDR